jgi:phage shock protein PspC (stress-responsive transcriptional regulator)
MTQPPPAPATQDSAPPAPQLLRGQRQKVVAGVCGGLGRYYDIDPVIFRIVIGVLTVTGGIGLIFYGFAWLLIPLEGEEENEARRLLSGRVDGASLIAVLLALIGCGLFLSMLNNGGMLSFSAMLAIAVVGSAVWSQRRRAAAPDSGPRDAGTAHTVAEAPPETKPPPAPASPSWWRDPIIKDGTTGPVGAGYLWGPADAVAETVTRRRSADAVPVAGPRGPRRTGGLVFLLALLACGLGTGLSWGAQPLGTSLQIGLAAALGVFGLGIVAGALRGRTGFGTVFLAVLTAGLLAAASAVPKDISTHWARQDWRPASVAEVRPRYQLGSGLGTLDLGGLAVPVGRTVVTSAEVGAGRLRVVVPRGVTVKVLAQAGLGGIRLPGEPDNDVDVSPSQSRRRTLPPGVGTAPAGTLELRLQVGVGQVEVSRAAP